jgi:hypothetical protein
MLPKRLKFDDRAYLSAYRKPKFIKAYFCPNVMKSQTTDETPTPSDVPSCLASGTPQRPQLVTVKQW